MRREGIASNAHSASLGSSSRATTRKVDHSTIFPRGDLDAGRNDSPKGVPIVQPYGFAYWPMPQEEEEQKGGQQQSTDQSSGGGGPGDMAGPGAYADDSQPKGKSAIGLTSYANGSRSDPSVQNLQDPRHQLMLEDPKQQGQQGQQGGGQQAGGGSSGGQQQGKGGKAGDVALYRTNDPKNLQQLHLTNDGPRMTSVKTQRFTLIEGQGDQQQQGGGAPTGPQGGQKQQKQDDGQRPIFKDPGEKSDKFLEQAPERTLVKHGQGHQFLNSSDATQYYEDKKKSHQCTEEHVHMRFKDLRVWIDKDGIWSTVPILVKQDDKCKE